MTNKNIKPVAVIVIPTYNEAIILAVMIDYLNTKTFPYIKAKKGNLTYDWQMKILDVDVILPMVLVK
jgi:hypothetical protein